MAVRGGTGGEGRGRSVRTDVTQRRAIRETDRRGDTTAQRTGAGNPVVAISQDTCVDGDRAGEGIVTGEGQEAGAGLDEVRDARAGGLVLDRRADGQAAGIELMDDEVTGRIRADAQAAGAADRVGVRAGDEDTAAVGTEAEVEGAEREGLRGAGAVDLEREDIRGRGGLGLAAAEGVVTRGDGAADRREGTGVGLAGRGAHAAEDDGAGARGAEPIEVRAVGEDRAAVAVDVFGGARRRGGDLRVGGSRHEERAAGGRAGGNSQATEREARERGVARDDGEHATALAGGETTEGLGGSEAGAADHRETTGLDGDRRGGEKGLEGAAVGEIQDEGAALDRGRAGVGAGDRGREGEDARTQLGDSQVGGRGRGSELTRERGGSIGATDGESASRASRIGHEAGAGQRPHGLIGRVVEVEGRARGDRHHRAVRKHAVGVRDERARVDDRGAAMGRSRAETEDACVVLDEVAAGDEAARRDFDFAGAGDDDLGLAGTQAAGEADLARRRDGQRVVEVDQRGDLIGHAGAGFRDRDGRVPQRVHDDRTRADIDALACQGKDAGLRDHSRLDDERIAARRIADVQRS